MKLIGNLKDQVEKANSKEEAKGIIEKAGMELTEEEVEMVAGGISIHPGARHDYDANIISGNEQTRRGYDENMCFGNDYYQNKHGINPETLYELD